MTHKPSSVTTEVASVIYLCDLPSGTGRDILPRRGKKINPLRAPGLHGLTARKVCLSYRRYRRYWWALTPPFHHHR